MIRAKRVRIPFFIIHCSFFILFACSTPDPILEGTRTPVFKSDQLKISGRVLGADLGAELEPKKCGDIRIDSENRIWKGGVKIFSGLPTESKFNIEKQAACNGMSVYAGLSTGELIKVNHSARNLEWTADIFDERTPTKNGIFLDIIAPPVYDAGFIYAGGLGGLFCKVRDADGAKVWCLPIAVESLKKSTAKYIVVRSADGKAYAVAKNGKIFEVDEP